MRSLTIQIADTVEPEAINRKVTRSEPSTKEEGEEEAELLYQRGKKFRLRKANAIENKTRLLTPGERGGRLPAIVITVDYCTSKAGFKCLPCLRRVHCPASSVKLL